MWPLQRAIFAVLLRYMSGISGAILGYKHKNLEVLL